MKPEINAVDRWIIEHLANGLTGKQIAESMHMTTLTIETYRTRLFKRLNLNNSCHLVAWAYRTGILTDVPIPQAESTPNE